MSESFQYQYYQFYVFVKTRMETSDRSTLRFITLNLKKNIFSMLKIAEVPKVKGSL